MACSKLARKLHYATIRRFSVTGHRESRMRGLIVWLALLALGGCMKLSDLGAVQGAEQSDYDKYLNELQQYNTNRNFDYQTWADAYSRIANDVQTASALEQLDYTKYLNELNQYNTDRSFNYQNLLDEINQQTGLRGEALEKAQLAAQYGDYSYLRKLGIDTSAYEAALAAKGTRSGGGGSGSGTS